RCEEEMNVEACKLARLQPPFRSRAGEPRLPFLTDEMMPHVRRIAHEQRRTRDLTERGITVVAEPHLRARGQSRRREMTTSDHCSERIHLDADELRRPKAVTGRDEKPRRPRARIDNPDRLAKRAGPSHHHPRDPERCVRCAVRSTLLRRSERAESIS